MPTSDSELGLTEFETRFTAAGLALVNDGPNSGYVYFTEIPLRVEITSHINKPVFASGSDFLQLQYPERRTIDGKTYCSMSEVQSFLPLVQAHEGLTRDAPHSHVQIYMDVLDLAAPVAFEALVGTSDMNPSPLVKRLRDLATAESRKLDTSGSNPFHTSCYIRFSSGTTPPGQ